MPEVTPAEQEDRRSVVFFFILTFIFFTQNNRAPPPDFTFLSELAQDEQQRNFDVLANTTHGQFATDSDGPWLNLTGFREDDSYHWDVLPIVQDMSRRQQWATKDGEEFPFYDEITGQMKGDFTWSQHSQTWPNNINFTTLDRTKDYFFRDHWQRNITEEKGEITLALTDDELAPAGQAREIKADIAIWTESGPGNGWEWHLRGVHFPHGAAILSSTSSKFDALPALPHFAWDEATFEAARPIMNDTLGEVWKHTFHHDLNAVGIPRCELIVWLQPHPLPGSKEYIRAIENELIAPEGLPIGTPPLLSFSAVIFSPDCGYVLESASISGAKTEAFTNLTRRLLLAFAMSLGLQIALLRRQMKKAATPSTRSRIAYQGIVIAALGDGLILFLMLGLLISDGAGFLVVAAAFFMSCVHVACLEVKFVYDIWHVQVGEPLRAEADRQRRVRQQQQAQTPADPPAAAPPPSNGQTATAMATATAATTTTRPTTTIAPSSTAPPPTDMGATPIPIPPPTPASLPPLQTQPQTQPQPSLLPTTNPLTTTALPDPPTTFTTLYYRFYLTLILLLFLSLFATTWPRPLRSLYTNTLTLLYFSLWLPQIHRNAIRNCRKALSWEYVAGSSVLRALPVLYWYVAERNVLGVRRGVGSAVALGGWLGLQVVVLGWQGAVGPRWGVGWCGGWPEVWEYHPRLVQGDVEGGVARGVGGDRARDEGKRKGRSDEGMDVRMLASAGGGEVKDQDEGRRCFDCAICMGEIDVPVLKRDNGGGSGGMGKGVVGGLGLGLGMERAKYMVTPCRHIFHAECLEGWMALRLVCPVCREELPPL